MTGADALLDRAGDRLQQLAGRLAGQGGLAARLADPLAEDAAFVRKLKPSLVLARIRGQAPTGQAPGATTVVRPRPASGAAADAAKGSGGPNPFLVVGAALVVGLVVAKAIDWRGHAHPRL